MQPSAPTRAGAGEALSRVRFTAGPPTTVVSDARRRAAGLAHWVDGTMGIVRHADGTSVVAPNGPVLARHRLSGDDDLLDGLVAAEEPIEGLPADVHHASGGPVHLDPETGLQLLVYHGETFVGGDHADYWSFLGMAVGDGGRFHDLGPIITSDHGLAHPERERPLDVGSGAFVVRDGWMHVFFQDRSILGIRRHLSVARARVDDVVAAARRGEAPTFRTWSGAGFDEPGLGGRAAELMADRRMRVLWFDAAFVEPLDAFMVVFATVVRAARGEVWWNHAAVLSADGVTWDEPTLISAHASPWEMLYVTLDSGGPDPRTITGDRFALYRVAAAQPDRWSDARLERVEVRICAPSASPTTSRTT